MTTAVMNFFTIDTLQFSRRLQKAGLNQKVSEELAEAIKDSQTQAVDGLATKQDLKILEQKFDGLEQKFGVLEQKFGVMEQKMEVIEHKIVTKMFLMLTVAVGLITWLDKVIK